MKEKGFTLIELLAVITVLAFILLITTPVVLKTISDSKKNLALKGSKFYLDSVEISLKKEKLKSNKIEDGIYYVDTNGNLCMKLNTDKTCKKGFLEVEVNGDIPEKGRVTIKDGAVSFAKLNYQKNNIIKENNEVKFGEQICILLSGERNEIGSKYQCKVKEEMEEEYKDGYIFYVLSYNTIDGKITKNKEEAVSTNLILDRNICKDGTLTNKDKTDKCTYEYASDEDCEAAGYAYGVATKGPITAQKLMDQATANWKEELKLDESYMYGFSDNNIFYLKGKARIPSLAEVNPASGEKYVFLYENLKEPDHWTEVNKPKEHIPGITGYWLKERTADSTDSAWYATYNGYLTGAKARYNHINGIRPVIRVEF